ncbi:MAG: DUF6268 family outer membrane beta-barrel protein [Cyclobacteriaceae bacterium]|nr:DUF6268 family outer membrane beta-barrel protein [Cyclobacteriaceae bacterium]
MKYISTFIACMVYLSSQSQNYLDIIRFDFDYTIPQTFEDTTTKSVFHEMTLDATLPIVINQGLSILTGFNTERVNVTPFSANSTPENVYGIMLKAGINKVFSERWSGTYLILPKLSSDLSSTGKNDRQLGALALMKLSQSPTKNLKFGMYVNSDLFGPMIVPLFGYYQLKNNLEINFTIPMNADINVRVSDQTKIGFRFNGTNKSYHLNVNPDQYLVKVNNEIGPYLQVATGRINFLVNPGYSVGRSFKTFGIGDEVKYAISLIRPGDVRQQLNTKFGDGLFVKSSIIYRFDLTN